MSIVHHIYVGTVNGKPLRFFASPVTIQPDLPWHSFDDLVGCLRLPGPLRQHFKSQLQSEDWRSEVRTVATPNGITTICPHFMAQGMLGAARDVGMAETDRIHEYIVASMNATAALTRWLPEMDRLEWNMQAVRRGVTESDPEPDGAA